MKNFLKRLGRTLLDLATSKKALATIGGIVAHKTGADPEVVAAVIGYVVAQGVADHGKEAVKANERDRVHAAEVVAVTARDRALAAELAAVREKLGR